MHQPDLGLSNWQRNDDTQRKSRKRRKKRKRNSQSLTNFPDSVILSNDDELAPSCL